MPSHDNSHHRSLVDFVRDNALDHDLDVSDEEDAFYAGDEGDYLLRPKWRAMITRTSNRFPRRIQRYFVIYIFIAIVLLITWATYVRPRYNAFKEEQRDMDVQPERIYGLNARPKFEGMVQVKKLDKKHLPKGEGRLVVVGDVHGCRDDLEVLLDKVKFRKGVDHLVLTGDIIAKGPHSPGVVSLAERLGASCVRGNHEDKVLLSIADADSYHNPAVPDLAESFNHTSDGDQDSQSTGGNKIRKLAKSFSKSQLTWLRSCPVILDVGPIGSLAHVVVVHAGLVPDVPLEEQDPFSVMNMRTINLKNRRPSEERKGTPWEKFWNHQQRGKPEHERVTVIYGHNKKRGQNIRSYSMGLDTGCVTGGKLTAMVIDEGGAYQIVQVGCKGYLE